MQDAGYVVGGTGEQTDCVFYADDGKVGTYQPKCLQRSLDVLSDLFLRLGLRMNAKKTKVMVTKGRIGTIKQSTEAYNRRTKGEGKTHRERERQMEQCPLCDKVMQRKSLRGHLKRTHAGQEIPTPAEEEEEEDEVVGEFVCEMPSGNSAKGDCPIPGCGEKGLARRQGVRSHVCYRHPLANRSTLER